MDKNGISRQNKIIMGAAIAIAAVIIVFAIMNTQSVNPNSGGSATGTTSAPGKYDAFAQCLANAGATMYGAVWCPHCQELKATFGNSFRYIKYVECPDNTQLCLDKGVNAYPTWILGTTTIDVGFDGNDTMKLLASSTGCALPQ